MLEGLDALDLAKLTSSKVEDAHELEGRANVSEALDYAVVHLEVFEARKDLSDHLQVMARGVNAQLDLGQFGEFLVSHVEVL